MTVLTEHNPRVKLTQSKSSLLALGITIDFGPAFFPEELMKTTGSFVVGRFLTSLFIKKCNLNLLYFGNVFMRSDLWVQSKISKEGSRKKLLVHY